MRKTYGETTFECNSSLAGTVTIEIKTRTLVTNPAAGTIRVQIPADDLIDFFSDVVSDQIVESFEKISMGKILKEFIADRRASFKRRRRIKVIRPRRR